MITKLVSFGCSWTYGEELIDTNNTSVNMSSDPLNDEYRNNHSYPGLIANQFGWEYENLATIDASLQSMIWSFNQWLVSTTDEEKHNTFVLVGLTDEARNSWHSSSNDTNIVHSANLSHCDDSRVNDWRQFNELYATLIDCDARRKALYLETVYFFDGASARYNISMLQVNVLTQLAKPSLPTLTISNTSLMEMLVLRTRPRKNSLFAHYKHPNENGHLIISEHLIPEVESVIINE